MFSVLPFDDVIVCRTEEEDLGSTTIRERSQRCVKLFLPRLTGLDLDSPPASSVQDFSLVLNDEHSIVSISPDERIAMTIASLSETEHL